MSSQVSLVFQVKMSSSKKFQVSSGNIIIIHQTYEQWQDRAYSPDGKWDQKPHSVGQQPSHTWTETFLVTMCHVGVGVLNTLCTDRAAQLTRSPRPNQCLQSDLQARAKVISLFFVNSDGTNLLTPRLTNKFVCLKDAFAGNKNLIDYSTPQL